MNANTLKIDDMMDTESDYNKILIVDDDVASCRTLQLHLSSQNYKVSLAHSVDEGMAAARRNTPNLVILDIRMPGKSGLDGLLEFKAAFPDTRIIMITAFHDMESTILAMQRGAEDYIHKPIDIDELDSVVQRLLLPRKDKMVSSNESDGEPDYNTMVGRSRAMKEVFKTIGLVASNPVTVLITGESGTGKELVARAIHRASANPDKPFVAVNCAALVETLIESDMFGHEKGAFTGAVNRQQGKFALASDGTLFLDEIGELSQTMQAKLLRVLQEKEYTPLGAKAPLRTNARIIAATNVNLAERVQEGRFREDLYYRLCVVNIHIPPLRDRKEDIVSLVQALLTRINGQMNKHVNHVPMDVLQCMQAYSWPGNVRELENVLAKAIAMCPGDTITPDLVGSIISCEVSDTTIDDSTLSEWSLEQVEKSHIKRVLDANNWHKGKACEILGISRPRLRRMIKQYDLTSASGGIFDDAELDEENGDEA